MTMIRLLRYLPPETAHALAIWGIRTGSWRVVACAGALITLAWAVPATRVLRWLEARTGTNQGKDTT